MNSKAHIGVGDFKIIPNINLTGYEEEILFKEYINDSDRINSLELTDLDFCSPTILRDRYGSRIQKYYFLKRKIDSSKNHGSLVKKVLLPNIDWYNHLKKQSSVALQVNFFTFLKLIICKYSEKIRNIINLFFFLIENIYESLLNKNLYNEDIDPELIFFSPIHGNFKEPYFEKAINYCIKKNKKVILSGPSFSGNKTRYRLNDNVCVDSLNGFLELKKIPFILKSIIYEYLRNFPDNSYEMFKHNYEVFKLDWQESFMFRCSSLLIKEEFKYILSKYPNAKLFTTYEGNTWEKSLSLALKDLKDQRKLFGYLHCAILPSHTKLYLGKGERLRRPLPDLIFCTGKNAKESLLNMGYYPDNKVLSGFALRENKLPGLNSIKMGKSKLILVLLEGLTTMTDFLEVILNALDKFTEKKIIVRTHPTLKLNSKAFDSIRNHRNFNQLEESQIGNIFEDISRSELVIYQGTTASLYAAYMGVPLVRFKSDWWISDNPLHFISRDIIPEFSQPNELIKILRDQKKIWNSSKSKFLSNYVREYLHDPEEVELENFINQDVTFK